MNAHAIAIERIIKENAMSKTISIHGPTAVNGNYNVIGIEDGCFILQGNLTVAQIKELRNECNLLLKTIKAEEARQAKDRR